MKDVIKSTHGTGHYANIPGIGLAGKTGTAEIDKTREISWFACFWTSGNYKRLIIVVVDAAPDEGKVKFTIAKELLTP
jgi:cell division protein FtsI/penicillin-binding protein 2